MEPAATTNTPVEEYLGLTRGGIRLPSSIKDKTATYITTTLMIEFGEEVQDLGVDAFLEAVNAAWEAEVPEPLVKMLRKWFETPVSKAKIISSKSQQRQRRRMRGHSLTLFSGEKDRQPLSTRTSNRT